MPLTIDIALVVVGVLLVGGSRALADGFRIPGRYGGLTGAIVRFSGLGDDAMSRLYRWAVAMMTGLALLIVGGVDAIAR